MRRRDAENPLVVMLTASMAIVGVVALRGLMTMDFRHWALAYVAMAMTAAVRRTQAGIDCSSWSLLRGLACLMVGLYTCRWLGYPMNLSLPTDWVPEEVAMALINAW